VITALLTGALKNRSAFRLSWRRMNAEISGGVKVSGLKIFCQMKGKELEFFANIFEAATHKAFYGVDGPLRRFDQILTSRIADDDLIAFVEGYDRGHKVQSVLAWDHGRALPLHESHQGVGGSEIDAYDAIVSHEYFSSQSNQSLSQHKPDRAEC
jgi:hypothetical protein